MAFLRTVKDKAREPTPDQSVIDQTSAFLNAVVTAASATADQSAPQFPFQSPVPSPFPIYAPQPPQYVPGPPPSHPSFAFPPFVDGAHAHHPLSVPRAGPNAPLPAEFFGSQDDLIRMLHDFDISKIANVIKSLGDAATGANFPITSLPSAVPQMSSGNPSSSSNDTTTVPVPLEHVGDNMEHAQLLATK